MIQEAIRLVVERKDLSVEQAHGTMMEMMKGDATPSQIASFITAMRMKGETEQELLGFVTAMRERSARLAVPDGCIDLCGTGGDGSSSFNISTAASFVAAAAGAPVAKHGNRSVSSRSGSADVLYALGIPIDLPPDQVGRCISSTGLGFMFAPVFHESMRNVSGPRREIGLRTIFNVLGPMTNPANVRRQLIGVYDPKLAPMIAGVLNKLGTTNAMIVHGAGMDELTTSGRTQVVELADGRIHSYNLEPGLFGLNAAEPRELSGGDAQENARIMLSVLKGAPSPKADVVALNAAAAIYVSGRVNTIHEGLRIAQQTMHSGKALELLKRFADMSRSLEAERQRSMEPHELSTRRLMPEVLLARSRDLCGDLLEKVRVLGGNALLEDLDDRLIDDPNVLSVLVLNRLHSQLTDRVDVPSKSNRRSSTCLSESIASSPGISVIAEYKPSSPGEPVLSVPPDAGTAASVYSTLGIAGVSVLVEPNFFQGSEELFSRFRSIVKQPMLFKDFVVSEKQVEIASRLGADSVLLISKALTDHSLNALVRACIKRGMEPLVEVHDELDMSKLLACPSIDHVKLVGVNTRDLETLRTDLSIAQGLRRMVPSGKICIAESGIHGPEDLGSVKGFDAILVGSMFMRSNDIARDVSTLLSAGASM